MVVASILVLSTQGFPLLHTLTSICYLLVLLWMITVLEVAAVMVTAASYMVGTGSPIFPSAQTGSHQSLPALLTPPSLLPSLQPSLILYLYFQENPRGKHFSTCPLRLSCHSLSEFMHQLVTCPCFVTVLVEEKKMV